MPSLTHETVVEMFRRWPGLAAELLGGVLGLSLPAHEEVRLDSSDFTDVLPTEYRSDTTAVLWSGGQPVLGVVVEVQLRRAAQKRWTWPVYVATLRARNKCPAVLLVMCPDGATAAWCSAPIELGGPGSQVVPVVFGPSQMPVVTDIEQAAREPEMAVLSAMAHGADPERRAVLDALVAACDAVDQDHRLLYSETVLAVLPDAARAYLLEAFMDISTYEPQTAFWRQRYAEAKAAVLAEASAEGAALRAEARAEGAALRAEARAEGLAEGLAEGVLALLESRGIAVDTTARRRITGCTDLHRLGEWVRRAATVDSAAELFS